MHKSKSIDHEKSSPEIQVLIDQYGYNPIDASLILRAEIWPIRPAHRRFPRDFVTTILKDKAAFCDSGDSEICLRAHIGLTEAGFCPPPWVSDALATGFRNLLAGDKNGFHRQLNITAGRGGTSREERERITHRDLPLVQDIVLLATAGSLTVSNACLLMEAKADNGGFPNYDPAKTIDYESMRKTYYSSGWAVKVRKNYHANKTDPYVTTLLNSRDLKAFAASFPDTLDARGNSILAKLISPTL